MSRHGGSDRWLTLHCGNNLGATVARATRSPSVSPWKGQVPRVAELLSAFGHRKSRRSRDEPGIDRPFVLMKCLLSESLSNDMEESAASDTSTCHQRVKDQRERERERGRRSETVD